MSDNWKGKVAVITGGTTGIGLALAKALAAEGMNLVISSRNPDNLKATADALKDSGIKVLTVPCDVADRAQVYALAEKVKEAFGHIDLLCANAGATTVGRLVDHGDADWDWALDVNFRGVTNCIQAFYPDMEKRGSGTILMTSSQVAVCPDWVLNHGPYTAAKAAVLGLGLSLRPEAAKHGVKVSILVPAGTETEIVKTKQMKVPDKNGADFEINAEAPKLNEDFPFFLSTEEVAERAIDGLRRNAAMIVTHETVRPLAEKYCDDILSAYDDALKFKSKLA